MKQLILLRHGQSLWNLEDRFTGWTDVDLSNKGRAEALEAGRRLLASSIIPQYCFTSYLRRAIHTLDIVLDKIDRCWLPVVKDWHLNERHYGALQGLNKSETAEKFGEEQVLVWRRSFDVRPPVLEPSDERNPANQAQYRDEDKSELPLGESLKDTIARTVPYFENEIAPKMREGKRVIIAAHGNSLRALVMHFEKLTPDEIMKVNLPTGVPLVYEFDDNFNVISKRYLGDPEVIAAKINKVAAQGKKH